MTMMVSNTHSNLSFAEDIKIFCVVISSNNCTSPQSDNDSIQGWWAANAVKPNIIKIINIIF